MQENRDVALTFLHFLAEVFGVFAEFFQWDALIQRFPNFRDVGVQMRPVDIFFQRVQQGGLNDVISKAF